MAIVSPTGSWLSKRVHRTTWETLTNGDTGAAQSAANLPDKTVQVFGTFGAGGTIIIQGSNDGGTTWVTLSDPQGNPLSFTSAGMEAVLENPALIRPNVTAGDGTTDLDCILVESTSR